MSDYKMGHNCQIVGLSDIYKKYFKEPQESNGFFIEVGSYDGFEFSNVWGLTELNWSGIMIEPNPISFAQLQQRFKDNNNIKCINIAIGKQEKAKLWMRHAISTTSEHQNELYKEAQWFNGMEQVIDVDMIGLDKLLMQEKCPLNFEVLVVDVEGIEMSVLETFSIDLWKPKMCIVEAQENHHMPGFDHEAKAVNEYFDKFNYEKIYSDEINNIYVRR